MPSNLMRIADYVALTFQNVKLVMLLAFKKTAIFQIIDDKAISVIVWQIKYLNNIVEQDHRAVKRITNPMLNFKLFHAAKNVLAGLELMHMIRKG